MILRTLKLPFFFSKGFIPSNTQDLFIFVLDTLCPINPHPLPWFPSLKEPKSVRLISSPGLRLGSHLNVVRMDVKQSNTPLSKNESSIRP